MEIRPVGAELFQTDGPTGRHDEVESRLKTYSKPFGGRESAVGIATLYWLDDSGVESR